ncbi:MAG: hypothetical protein HC782_02470 [Gammaproteobacteria bacterium]|nr:hypothetical protein [Gammaproteobacteria bacterium]
MRVPMRLKRCVIKVSSCLVSLCFINSAVVVNAQPAQPAPDVPAPAPAPLSKEQPKPSPVPPAKPAVQRTESIEVNQRRTATTERRDSSASKIIIRAKILSNMAIAI